MSKKDSIDEMQRSISLGFVRTLDTVMDMILGKVAIVHPTNFKQEFVNVETYDYEKLSVDKKVQPLLKTSISLYHREEGVEDPQKFAEVLLVIDTKEWEKASAKPLPPEVRTPGKPDPTFGTQERRLLAELRGGIQELLGEIKEAPRPKDVLPWTVEQLEQMVANSMCPVPDRSVKDLCIEALGTMTPEERIEVITAIYPVLDGYFSKEDPSCPG